ncbi:uncharacterized protein SPPG_00490 [Spizellomyces punctatus DAOM BR117]|uniref:F-box domain-containing protein n=1 Tax=Spizellomyces punctatus (strain DAOM BR117) TaxID=645134 RepID=A0A0L0HTW4_SPIPD|nr:uncharacterized protein SPPG_00490 [Spizellomyces punctatus DAOM BR117]KND04786.1 hypothetical protein SPPG_00490 [Spizellomyces punctatus DAOM BR117]|eukprot:XP_016612825.1 hypothetical protein SPPG_00490 [Spizellomyces punctatus DAOM BR117]
MDTLPTELVTDVLIYLAIPVLWRLRRVSRAWKESTEIALATRLRTLYGIDPSSARPKPLDTLIILDTAILLTSGTHPASNHRITYPVFGRPVVSCNSMELAVRSVDLDRKCVELIPVESPVVNLVRDVALGRYEWCAKGAVRSGGKERTSSQDVVIQSHPFTLVAPDMDLRNEIQDNSNPSATSTLSNYEFQLIYSAIDTTAESIASSVTTLSLRIHSLIISYTYLFYLLSPHPPDPATRISIFPPDRVRLLQNASAMAGLTWHHKYYTFDIVLHWLASEDGSEADVDPVAVVEYLMEYEKVMENRRQRVVKNRGRFLRVPS